jgi:hypothetical protein
MIHVVARSEITGASFIRNHPTLEGRIVVQLGQCSYFELINKLIIQCSDAWVCLVHDDVLLPHHFWGQLEQLLESLRLKWPNWGLVGNAGISSMRFGFGAQHMVRYLSDPHGGPNLCAEIVPAQTIDGNVMLLNLAALRERGVQLPLLSRFHLYDITLSIETLANDLAVLIAPQLACWHGSKGDGKSFYIEAGTEVFNDYLLKRIRQRILTTINGEILVRLDGHHPLNRGKLDVELDSVRLAARGRPKKRVAIVTRSMWKRPQLLNRTLASVEAFIAAAVSDDVEFKPYIVSSVKKPSEFQLSYPADILYADLPDHFDTRFLLVHYAVNTIDADYFWFLDDDDWLFPNEAIKVAYALNVAPSNSVVFVDTQHFLEKLFDKDINGSMVSTASVRFYSKNFSGCFEGKNTIPFCGVIFSRSSLMSIDESVYNAIVYYEDYASILHALLSSGCFPIALDILCMGISVRSEGNQSINQVDRLQWNKSMAELVSYFVNKPGYCQLFGMYSSSSSYAAFLRHQMDRMQSSRSWRLTKPLRIIGNFMRRNVFISKLRGKFFNG